ALRDVANLRNELRCADEFAWECYRPALECAIEANALPTKKVRREPPLVFFSDDASPFVQTRDTVILPGATEQSDILRFGRETFALPVPVIGVPWLHLNHLPAAATIAHEVGHTVEDDFELSKSLNSAFATLPEARRAAWQAWR